MADDVRDGQRDAVRTGVTSESNPRPVKPRIGRSVHGWYTINGGFAGSQSFDRSPPRGAPSDHWDRWVQWIGDHIQLNNEGEVINMRTLTIELRFDADEDDKHEVLREAAKAAAKHLFTNALLISTKRRPQIAMYTSDMFAGQEEISLAADLDE